MNRGDEKRKEDYTEPKVLVSFKNEELQEIIKPHGNGTGGGGCGCGCGCGCGGGS